MEGINYSEIVQTVLQKHTVNHLSDGTEKQLIFDVQRDLTEVGIGNELAELGIPKTDVVLGFRSPYLRQFTGFGIG